MLIAVLLLALTAVGANAKSIYKSVGPDGKITYSDHPPENGDAVVDVAAGKEPAPADATRSAGIIPLSTRPAGAKKAIAVRPDTGAPAVDTGGVAPNLALEGAIIGVLGIEDIVKHTEELCIKTLPTSLRKYSDAASDWRQRNAAIVTRAHQVLGKNFDVVYGAGSEQRLQMAIRDKNVGMFEPIVIAPAAARIKWCDQSVEEMQNGAMDVYDKPKLSEPLLSYR